MQAYQDYPGAYDLPDAHDWPAITEERARSYPKCRKSPRARAGAALTDQRQWSGSNSVRIALSSCCCKTSARRQAARWRNIWTRTRMHRARTA